MLYNTKKFAGLFNRAQPLTNRENSKYSGSVISGPCQCQTLSKFQTCVSWNSRSRGQDVKKFGTRAGIRIFVLQCSHNFKTNAAETTGKQEAKLFESNAQHLLIYTKCG